MHIFTSCFILNVRFVFRRFRSSKILHSPFVTHCPTQITSSNQKLEHTSLEQKVCLSVNVLQLKWNLSDSEKTFFSILCIWNRKFSEVAILAPKVCSTSLCAGESHEVLKRKFVHFNMFHSSTETEKFMERLVFSMVLNFMGIGTF